MPSQGKASVSGCVRGMAGHVAPGSDSDSDGDTPTLAAVLAIPHVDFLITCSTRSYSFILSLDIISDHITAHTTNWLPP